MHICTGKHTHRTMLAHIGVNVWYTPLNMNYNLVSGTASVRNAATMGDCVPIEYQDTTSHDRTNNTNT